MTPDQMAKLAARLREHAHLHRKYLPKDNEQKQWTADLDAAAELIAGMAQQGAVAATLIVRQESDTPKVTGWNEVVFPVGEEVALYLAPQAAAASPDNIAALLDRLDAAERENERLREDAERYRWLRGDACPDHSVRWTQWEVRCWVAPFWSGDLRREGLDRSIDAAMAAEQSDERREG